MSFPKRLVQVITLSVFFFLMAGFVAYRSGISFLTQDEPQSDVLDGAVAALEQSDMLTTYDTTRLVTLRGVQPFEAWLYEHSQPKSKRRISRLDSIAMMSSEEKWSIGIPAEADFMYSSKVGVIARPKEWEWTFDVPWDSFSLPPQDTTKKKTKNLGITVNPSVTDLHSKGDTLHVMTKEDSAAYKRALIMSSSKSMIVKPPKVKPSKKKEKN